MITDYLLYGQAFAYIKKNKNQVESLHYIDNQYVNVTSNYHPIFKDAKVHIQGQAYHHFDFIKLLKNTPDGVRGTGLIQENKELISLAYKLLNYQRNNVETGGIKKGVIKSSKKLNKESLDALKKSWKQLYGKDSTENCIILNDGLEYQDLASTPVEMQMHDVFDAVKEQVSAILNVPESILQGTASEYTQNNFIKHTILPILQGFETALNQTLLLEREKGVFYFAFDTKEFLKGDMEKRYKAYEIGIKNGFLFPDEVRYMEDYAPMGLDFIKLQLSDVLYNPRTKEIYTPNTNAKTNLSDGATLKGGENE
jgi:HK97 family phage portal protein